MKSFIRLLPVLLLMAACTKKQDTAKSATPVAPVEIQVRVQPAVLKTLDKSIDVTGSLEADETVNLSFEIPGRVAAFRVDFGQLVRRARLSPNGTSANTNSIWNAPAPMSRSSPRVWA